MEMGSLDRIRSKRISERPIYSDKLLMKQGRGTFDFKSHFMQIGTVIRWHTMEVSKLSL